VTDAQGKVVSGATVTLTNPAKNFSRTQTTNESGSYSFNSIPPDTYVIEVTATGFKKTVVNEVQALVAKPSEANVQLEIGAVSEAVTVTSGGNESLLNTQDASLGNNFVSKQITQLPLEARDVTSLLTLQPGATREGYVAGARSDQSNVTLDGVDINEAQTNQIGAPKGGAGADSINAFSESPTAGTVLRLNGEAIEEFRVTTTNPNATQGRSSGAQISLVTKTGTNDFRGAAFLYNRDTAFTANNFFNNAAGRYVADDQAVIDGLANVGDMRAPRPKLKRNVFGGAIGGPIVKDKLFFFYSFEGRNDKSEEVVVSRVPLASMGLGQLRYFNDDGVITTLSQSDIAGLFPYLNGVNPAAVSALAAAAAKYPANDFSIGDQLNVAGYRFNAPVPVNLNSHVLRLDYNLASNQQLYGRFQYQQDEIGGTRLFPDTPAQDTWSHPLGLVVGHNWTINNNLVNTFRYGFTREAFTTQGDSTKNEIYFRNIFFPVNDSRETSRRTPVQNIVDDVSWVKGGHTFQFGTNIRIIRNQRTTFANAFDTAYTNPSGYDDSGSPITDTINDSEDFDSIGPLSDESDVRSAAAALFGRFTAFTSRFSFDQDGNLMPFGSPSERNFATEEYDFYVQDIWKLKSSLTLTLGLRYGLSRPVYETNGFEAKPNISLTEFFRRRVKGAETGVPYNDPLTVERSGPANGKSPLYNWDKNNWQPRIGVAWSPNFKGGFLGKLFGKNSESVIRGGFGITNDYYGQQLAVSFDLNNSLGFSTQSELAPSTCGIGGPEEDDPLPICPLFTSFSQDIRPFLPQFGLATPTSLVFPQMQPSDQDRRIEVSVDQDITAPTHYSWNLTYERTLPAGFVFQASYIGRAGRNLLAARDVATLNNFVDSQSGMDWYTAAGMLETYRQRVAPGINSIEDVDEREAAQQAALAGLQAIPYFENLFGGDSAFIRALMGGRRAPWAANATQAIFGDALIFNDNDWTTTQSEIDDYLVGVGRQSIFYHPQYAALSAISSVGNSNYNAGTFSLRQRLGEAFTMDLNYTIAHSLDDASGLQTSGNFGTSLILNPLRQRENYANSDFDVRHSFNANAVWQLPIGKGRALMSNANGLVDALLGGWQLSGIFRANSGLPIWSPYDTLWATNWNIQSSGVRTRPVESCPTRGGNGEFASLFGCDRTGAYQSWRNAKPGETGDRNVIRLPGYSSVDLGLAKSFTMPWGENHRLQFRAEAFNVFNRQTFGSTVNEQIQIDPQANSPAGDWWNFTDIQGTPRVMQFGLRYSF
jgi:hypothetical protein